jgi:hypothetical protein
LHHRRADGKEHHRDTELDVAFFREGFGCDQREVSESAEKENFASIGRRFLSEMM